jgi:hypothetical protein
MTAIFIFLFLLFAMITRSKHKYQDDGNNNY